MSKIEEIRSLYRIYRRANSPITALILTYQNLKGIV